LSTGFSDFRAIWAIVLLNESMELGSGAGPNVAQPIVLAEFYSVYRMSASFQKKCRGS
jgi:hypothetical protein